MRSSRHPAWSRLTVMLLIGTALSSGAKAQPADSAPPSAPAPASAPEQRPTAPSTTAPAKSAAAPSTSREFKPSEDVSSDAEVDFPADL